MATKEMEKGPENRRRVKLYVLNAARHWDDRGTGHVSAMYSDRLGGMSLIVRDEQTSAVLLESKIDTETSYQKQQETLIVWSENDADMALSFQEKAGCEEVWGKICQVQGKDPSVEITQDNLDDDDEDETGPSTSSYAPEGPPVSNTVGVPLPPCEIGRLDKIWEVIQSYMTHPHQRDKLANAIEQEDYIRKLLDVFRKCEDTDYFEGLQQLFSIIKSMLMLNRNALYEVLFSAECIENVLGCLEWDPTAYSPKRHRTYIRDVAKFVEVIPLENAELHGKIQQMYKVQYIQDVILPSPSVFEENMYNALQNVVLFSKSEIVNMIQDDERFLTQLFAQLMDKEIPLAKRRDTVLFLREFCQFSQTLEQTRREAFYRMLVARGVFQAIPGAMSVADNRMRAATVDVFTYIVEMLPHVVREYSMTQAAKEANESNLFFVHIIREAIVKDPEPLASGALQVLTIMRLILDPENMLNSPNRTEKTEFLGFFYKRCLQYLIQPITDVTATGTMSKRESLRLVTLLSLLLDFLSFCVEHHTFHIKNYIIGRDLLKPVLVLLQSPHQFLVVSVIRFLRKIIGLNDDFYNRYIEKGDHLKPVLDVFLQNGSLYNLLNSAILELFEYIRVEDIRRLIIYVIGKHWERLQSVTCAQTFNLLNIRYGIHTSPSPDHSVRASFMERPATPEMAASGSGKSLMARMGQRRYRRDDREPDEDEETWFENEDTEAVLAKPAAAAEAEAGPSGVAVVTAEPLPVVEESSEEGANAVKPLPFIAAKSLIPLNTAPPVKRPSEDEEDDDTPFSGPVWKYANRGTSRKSARSPTSFKITYAEAKDVHSIRFISFGGNSSNGPSSGSPPNNNHVSSSPPSTAPSTPPDAPLNHDNDNPKLLTTLAKMLPVASSSSLKPASPSLVDYPDDEEDHNGTPENRHSPPPTPTPSSAEVAS